LDSAELGIPGDLASEWEYYRQALHSLGISLNNSADELLWIGGDRSGILNSKNIYLLICDTQNFLIATGWCKNFWNWDLQLKVKLFLWLTANDKILTWSNLQRRGWEGPSRFYLCNYDCETTNHIFVHCSFTKQGWNIIKSLKFTSQNWRGRNLLDSLTKWMEFRFVYPNLAPLIC
jgi:hypothetical protein